MEHTSTRLSAWRFVIGFGVVAMCADIVYEGARSVTGPFLAHLGASALVVGVVTGVGESAALLLRLVSGPLAGRSGRFWTWTLAGYAITVVSVPLLGVTAVLPVAVALVIAERVGKAVRSPAKDTLLSHATAVTGRGRGFAVHEALDQFGALVGPLLVAGALAWSGGDYRPAFLVLAVPGAVTIALAAALRARVPDPAAYELAAPAPAQAPEPAQAQGPSVHMEPRPVASRLPRAFWAYASFVALTAAGFATFGVISFHLVDAHLVATAAVPVIYAGAMVTDALAAVATGWGYDRWGSGVLVALPVVAAVVPALAFSGTVAVAVAGALVWGCVLGIQESTLRARVADLVPAGRRATAYGVFGAVVGVAAVAGGALAGGLYEVSVPMLVAVTVVLQAAALVLLLATLRRV